MRWLITSVRSSWGITLLGPCLSRHCAIAAFVGEIPWESVFNKTVLLLHKWFVLFFLGRTVTNHGPSLFWLLRSLESNVLLFSSTFMSWSYSPDLWYSFAHFPFILIPLIIYFTPLSNVYFYAFLQNLFGIKQEWIYFKNLKLWFNTCLSLLLSLVFASPVGWDISIFSGLDKHPPLEHMTQLLRASWYLVYQ